MKFGSLPCVLTCAALALVASASHALPIQYAGNRAGFEATLSTKITDDYSAYTVGDISNSPSLHVYTDAGMSAVLGETDYRSTTFQDVNITFPFPPSGNLAYCAGCNGSFLLSFTSTSVGDATGVFGVGFDILEATNFHAFVVFGDNTTLDVALASLAPGFWGITADERIRSIHVGLANGAPTSSGAFDGISIDNLTIGRQGETVDPAPVPEPAGIALLGAGLVAAGLHRRRRHG